MAASRILNFAFRLVAITDETMDVGKWSIYKDRVRAIVYVNIYKHGDGAKLWGPIWEFLIVDVPN
jgi:hypothetical protein